MRIGQPTPPVARAHRANRRRERNGQRRRYQPPVFNFRAGRRIRGASSAILAVGKFLAAGSETQRKRGYVTFNLFVSEVAISGNRTTVCRWKRSVT